jgi:hypothetical protein
MQVFEPVCNNYQASLQISQPTLQDLGLLFESTLYEDVYNMVMAGECGFMESIKYTSSTGKWARQLSKLVSNLKALVWCWMLLRHRMPC